MDITTAKKHVCDVCFENGNAISAVTWCTVCSDALCHHCTDAHTRVRVSREHKLTYLNEGPDTVHINENVHLFCKHHEQPFCKACTETSQIPQERQPKVETEQSTSETGLLERMYETLSDGQILLAKRIEHQSTLELRRAQVALDIETQTCAIYQKVEGLKLSTLERLSKIHRNKMNDLQDDVDGIRAEITSLQKAAETLQLAVADESGSLSVLLLQDVRNQIEKSEMFFTNRKVNFSTAWYQFNPSQMISFLQHATNFGEVAVLDQPLAGVDVQAKMKKQETKSYSDMNNDCKRNPIPEFNPRSENFDDEHYVHVPDDQVKEGIESTRKVINLNEIEIYANRPKFYLSQESEDHSDLMRYPRDCDHVGNIPRTLHTGAKMDKSRNPVRFISVEKFNGRLPHENSTCNYTGVDMFENGDIIAADDGNRVVKIFNKHGISLSRKRFRIFIITFPPYSVAVLSRETVAVTYDDMGLLVLYSVKNGTLTQLRRIGTEDKVYSAVGVEERCVTLSGRGPETCLLTIDGVGVTNSMPLGDIIGNKEDLCGISYLRGKRIYLVTQGNMLIGFNNMAEVELTFTHTSSRMLQGVATDGEDNIFVAAQDVMKVLHISPEGELIQEISTEPLQPKCLAVCRKQNRLVVAGEMDGVYVFKID